MGHTQRSLIANAIWVSATPAVLRCAMVDRRAPKVVFEARPADQLPSLATLWARLDTLRLAALECTTPFCAERMITGSASRSAASAALRLPLAIASSTLRTKLRISERRPLLISVRRAILRAALRAEGVLGMAVLVLGAVGWPARRPDIVKSERRREPRRQGAAYSRLAWERQRPASGTLRPRAIDGDEAAHDWLIAADGGFSRERRFAAARG